MHEKLLRDDLEKAKKYVFLHEEGHRRDKIIGKIGETSEVFLSPPGLLLGLLIIATGFLSYQDIIGLVENPMSLISYTLTFYALMSLFSHLSEFRADFFVIDRVGIDGYKEGRENLRDGWPMNIFGKLLMYPSHPPNWLILKSYKLLRKSKN